MATSRPLRSGAALLAAVVAVLLALAPAVPTAIPSPASPPPDGVFGTTQEICYGLRGDVYFLEKGRKRLPNFSRMRPVGSVYATRLDIPRQPFDKGFPGVTDRFEWFAIDYHGRFTIECTQEASRHTIGTRTDARNS